MLAGCATYRAGVALPDTDTPVTALAAAGPGRLVWIGLADPSMEECQRLAGILHLDRVRLEALLDERPRARVQAIDGDRVVVAGAARYDTGRDLVEIGTLTCLVRPGMLITVARHVPPAATDLRRQLETREGTLSRGPSHVVGHLLDAVIAGYGGVLNDLRVDVQDVERQAFTDSDAVGISQRIYLLKREALDFRHAASGLLEPLGDLAEGRYAVEGDDGIPDWEGLAERVERLVDRSGAISDLLTGVLSAYQTDVALRQNEDMRKISAWVAIAAVPTLLAGIYGMNFDHMPELSSRLGYPAVLVVMGLVCTALYVLFRRKRWL